MPRSQTILTRIRFAISHQTWRNTLESFGLRAQLLHAILGVAVIVMLIVGFSLDNFPQSFKPFFYLLHMGLGLWILGGAVLWLISWITQPTPQRLHDQSVANFRAAKLVHKLLLVFCIIMPVTGWIMASAWGNASFRVAPYVRIPAIALRDPDFAKAMLGMHIVVAWTLVGLLSLHTAGALYHHIVKRDRILKRILPRFGVLSTFQRSQFDRGVKKTKSMR